MPACLELSDYSQPDGIRKSVSYMIGYLAEKSDVFLTENLLKKSFSLAQDPNFEIRQSMTVNLHKICRALGEEKTQNMIFEEIVKLTEDEEPAVRSEAMGLLIEIVDLLPFDFIISNILPILNKELREPSSQILKIELAKRFGQLIVKFEGELQEEFFKMTAFKFYRDICNSDEILRRYGAKNFPGVLLILGSHEFNFELKGMHIKLSKDIDDDVREIMAASLHEICKIVGDKSSQLEESLLYLLQDKAKYKLFQNLDIILSYMNAETRQKVYEIIYYSISRVKSPRFQVKILECLKRLLKYFKISDVIIEIFPEILNIIKTGV